MEYKVVILCSTYNHRPYIKDALDGFVSQKTDFPFCALIIDDFSTDNQQEIILQYADLYPNIIKPILLQYNHYQRGENKNRYIEPWFQKSEYIAVCEGDDYWTDPNKLQRQVDILDNNPKCTLTYHACKNVFVPGYQGYRGCFSETVKEHYNYKDLLSNYLFQTATVVYRSNMRLNELTKNILALDYYDITLFFCASILGDVIGINEQLSVYRRTNGGISNSIHKGIGLLKKYNNWLKIADLCDKNVRKSVHHIRLAGYIYELYDSSRNDFISACRTEMHYFPSVVIEVLLRIVKRRFSLTIRKIHKPEM